MTTKTYTANPNVGTRDWKRFILVDDNGKPVRESDSPLGFRVASGERPTDEWLFEDGYRGYVEPLPPEYNKYEQKCIKDPLDTLRLDPISKTYVQTYTIVEMNDDEKFDAQIQLKRDINDFRDQLIRKGCAVKVEGISNRVIISGSEENMRNISNLGQLASYYTVNQIPETIQFRDSANVVYTLTPGQMIAIWLKSMSYVSAIYSTAWMMKDKKIVPQDFINMNYWPMREID